MRKSLIITILLLALLVSGCGWMPVEETVPPVETVPVEEPSDVYSFRFCNGTGKDIYAISIREATVSEDYAENLLTPGLALNSGNWIELSYDRYAAEKAFAEIEKPANGVELTSEYRMLVVLEDGSHYELTAFPMGDVEECTVLLSDNVAYLSYVSLCTEQLIITKEAELATYERWGRQARDISVLVPQLTNELLPTVVETPAPTPSTEVQSSTEKVESNNNNGQSDPNEGCLTGGLFY